MTTGDEPMLPQSADDNAPMISGRGTKIYVHMRDAYRVGNLDRLLGGMDDIQRIKYKQALVRFVIWVCNLSVETVDQNPVGYTQFMRVIDWLNEPIPENKAAIMLLYRQVPAFEQPRQWTLSPLTYAFRFLGKIIITTSIRVADDASTMCIKNLNDRLNWRYSSVLARDVRQWRIDAAWAILQGNEIPPFPELSS